MQNDKVKVSQFPNVYIYQIHINIFIQIESLSLKEIASLQKKITDTLRFTRSIQNEMKKTSYFKPAVLQTDT